MQLYHEDEKWHLNYSNKKYTLECVNKHMKESCHELWMMRSLSSPYILYTHVLNEDIPTIVGPTLCNHRNSYNRVLDSVIKATIFTSLDSPPQLLSP